AQLRSGYRRHAGRELSRAMEDSLNAACRHNSCIGRQDWRSVRLYDGWSIARVQGWSIARVQGWSIARVQTVVRIEERFMSLQHAKSASAGHPATPSEGVYDLVTVDRIAVAYREAGSPADPKLVLLHGFPASSHQYRNLVVALSDRFHVIAPDYPGFGNSDAPDPKSFAYTFDRLSEVIEGFLDLKGFDRYGLFAQDYGGPVGF